MIAKDEDRLKQKLAHPSLGLGLGGGLPAGGAQAVPALDLNFLTGSLDSRITFTRASAATRVNASGQIENVSTNIPRFDHDPVTLAPRGLLIEAQRTQLLLNATIDGANLASQDVTVAAQTHALSFYGSGTITLSGAHAASVVGSGVFPARRILTFLPSAGTLTLTVTGTVQYPQLETGFFATSFIPSAGSQVTRSGDVARMTGPAFSGFYNQAQGSFLVGFTPITTGILAGHIMNVWQGDSNRISLVRTNATANGDGKRIVLYAEIGGVGMALIATVADDDGSRRRAAFAYAINDYQLCVNGASTAVDSSVALPIATDLYLGSYGGNGNQASGWYDLLRFYRVRMPDNALESLTG